MGGVWVERAADETVAVDYAHLLRVRVRRFVTAWEPDLG